jgi:hypothetical protein
MGSYQLGLVISVLTISTSKFWCTLNKSLASPTDVIPALHPIPNRLKLMILLLILNLFIIIAIRDG